MSGDPARTPAGPILATLAVGEGRAAVALTALAQGRDVILLVTGGAAHVGAVALRAPAGAGRGEPPASLAIVPGHREGPLADEAAAAIVAATGRACVAVVGIHQDAASAEEIALIVDNVREGYARLAALLAGEPGAPARPPEEGMPE